MATVEALPLHYRTVDYQQKISWWIPSEHLGLLEIFPWDVSVAKVLVKPTMPTKVKQSLHSAINIIRCKVVHFLALVQTGLQLMELANCSTDRSVWPTAPLFVVFANCSTIRAPKPEPNMAHFARRVTKNPKKIKQHFRRPVDHLPVQS
jgi:hypothetical protein